MNHTILVMTPACVLNERHLGMIRVQSLLRRRLSRYLLPDTRIVSVLVVDHADQKYKREVSVIASEFDKSTCSIPAHCGNQWGIRRPTNHAISDVAPSIHADFMLRVIQDTFVDNAEKLASDMVSAMAESGHWIAANVHHWPTGGHHWICGRMGLQCNWDLRYPNGALMFAPLATWRKYYLAMPEYIHHHWDDVIMGEWLRQSGDGKIIDIPAVWRHCHDCDSEFSQAILIAHQKELAATVQ